MYIDFLELDSKMGRKWTCYFIEIKNSQMSKVTLQMLNSMYFRSNLPRVTQKDVTKVVGIEP